MRKQKQRLERCYNVANPSKVADVDYLMKKYEGNEAKLFGQVRIIIILLYSLNKKLMKYFSFVRNIPSSQNVKYFHKNCLKLLVSE